MIMLAVAAALAVVVGATLALFGGGGSMLAVPILTLVVGLDAKSAIATSLVVVAATSASGALQHVRDGNVAWRVAWFFAGAGAVAAFVGGALAAFVPAAVSVVVFAVVMVAAAVRMWRGPADGDDDEGEPPRARRASRALLLGAVAGLLTGFVGAGGGFIVVPALTLAMGMRMRVAVGTCLVIIAIQSLAGLGGHIANGAHVAWQVAALFSALAVAGSFIGAALSRRVKVASLRKGFAALVVVMALVMVGQQLAKATRATATATAPTATATTTTTTTTNGRNQEDVMSFFSMFGGGNDAKKMIAGGALVIDVRTREEWDSGHLPMAKLLPVQELPQRIRDVEQWTGGDKTKPIVVHCRSGARSGQAQAILKNAGFTNVVNGGGYASLR